MNKTIQDAITILRSLTRPVTLEVDLEDELEVIEACPGELVQVWVNLIKNAVESLLQHDVREPLVKVKSWQSAHHIWVSVEDNGPGIDPSIIGKIYEPNFTTKVGGISLGLGLGLTIVNRIVAEHNGSIKVDSKPGSTRFTVKLRKKLNM
ncbi:MAG: ATP-binding protein [Cyclobacteriaceae bacterium]